MTLSQVFATIVPEERGVAFRAFDGSTAGPPDAEVTLELRSPRGAQYIATER